MSVYFGRHSKHNLVTGVYRSAVGASDSVDIAGDIRVASILGRRVVRWAPDGTPSAIALAHAVGPKTVDISAGVGSICQTHKHGEERNLVGHFGARVYPVGLY